MGDFPISQSHRSRPTLHQLITITIVEVELGGRGSDRNLNSAVGRISVSHTGEGPNLGGVTANIMARIVEGLRNLTILKHRWKRKVNRGQIKTEVMAGAKHGIR